MKKTLQLVIGAVMINLGAVMIAVLIAAEQKTPRLTAEQKVELLLLQKSYLDIGIQYQALTLTHNASVKADEEKHQKALAEAAEKLQAANKAIVDKAAELAKVAGCEGCTINDKLDLVTPK